jgi:hypothetical protein
MKVMDTSLRSGQLLFKSCFCIVHLCELPGVTFCGTRMSLTPQKPAGKFQSQCVCKGALQRHSIRAHLEPIAKLVLFTAQVFAAEKKSDRDRPAERPRGAFGQELPHPITSPSASSAVAGPLKVGGPDPVPRVSRLVC